MCRNDSKLYLNCLNTFSFPVNCIFIPEKIKTLSIESWAVFTDSVKIWESVKLLDYEMISIFLKHPELLIS